MKKELTCIVCPLGCNIAVEIENGQVNDISGYSCARGKAYAEEECIAPKRVLTTTVRAKSGELVAVKTSCPIPKEKMMDAMKIINSHKIDLPISIGDVIIDDVFGARLLATENKS